MPPPVEYFRVNYYVGGLLAQGGKLSIENSTIKYSPTSALDRAMGAKDVEIAFQQIQSMDYTGALSRAFNVKTTDRVHKFEGSQAIKAWEVLEKALPHKALVIPERAASSSVKAITALACDQCSKSLQPGFSYCPSCGCRPKASCTSCHRVTNPDWSMCAYCGWKFSAKMAA